MQISTIKTVFYSPTGTSRKVVQAIAKGAQTDQPVEAVDLTAPNYPENISMAADELTIFAVPVYAGRVAPLAVKRMESISGKGGPAIIVVLYGNREFEDALIELKDIVEAQSFTVVAGAAFIGEHSYSSTALPTAHGRPDESDLKIASDFGAKAAQLLVAADSPQPLDSVPGDKPYKDGMPFVPLTPQIEHELCTQCEECVAVCPSGAIALVDQIVIDVNLCTFCCACIKACPVVALSLAGTPMQDKAKWLNENCATRKEPELFS